MPTFKPLETQLQTPHLDLHCRGHFGKREKLETTIESALPEASGAPLGISLTHSEFADPWRMFSTPQRHSCFT